MLVARLQELVDRQPRHVAVSWGAERLSYSELYRSVLAFAGRLHALGIGEGDFVCLQLPNGLSFIVSFFAIAAVRAVAITVDPGLTPAERSRYLAGVTPAAAVTENASETGVDMGCPVISVDIRDDSAPLDPGFPYEGPALCQLSSGSTGLPKLVVRTQRHLMEEYRQLSAALKARSDDAVLVIVPLHHAHGFGNAMLFALCNGLRLVIPRPPRSIDGSALPLRLWRTELLDLMVTERVTIMPAVPFVFRLLAQAPSLPGEICLRLCISAGSRLDEETYLRFQERFEQPIRQLYGCTEAGSVTVNMDEDASVNWRSVGRPLPGVELRLTGDERAVAFRSGALADGYYGDDAADGAFNDGWFSPGDAGWFDDEGRLHIDGRVRRFIESGGFKIDPREVEQALCAHPQVGEAIVFGVPSPVLKEMVKAVVVPSPGATLDEAALKALLKERLAGHKQPRILETRESLPRSPLGKVLIRKLM